MCRVQDGDGLHTHCRCLRRGLSKHEMYVDDGYLFDRMRKRRLKSQVLTITNFVQGVGTASVAFI